MEYQPASYGHYVYPLWADAAGWVIGLLPVSVIILTGIVQVVRAPKELTFCEKIRSLCRPTAEWGPSGRPCWVPLDLKAINSYSSASQTRVLINGVPIDGGGGGNGGGPDESLQL